MSADPTEVLAGVYTLTAADYTALWSPVIRPMGIRLVTALPLAATTRVLDVGTGGGALLPVVAASAPKARVVGIDRSAGMLAMARSAAPAAGLALMDAEQLGLRSAAFDAAVLAFMLFHLPDPVRGLSEIARVLRRGGVVGTTTWGANQLLPRSDIWSEELDAAGAGAAALPETVQQHTRMDTPEKLRALLEAAGFQPLRLWTEPFERHWTRDELFSLRRGHGLFSRRLETLGEAVRRRCLERIRERMVHLAPAELVWRPEIVFAIGQTS